MKIFLLLFNLLVILICSSCDKNNIICVEHQKANCDTDEAKTNIRIKNNSGYEFCNVMLNPFNSSTNYGKIKKGKITCYRVFETAYSYAYVNLFINDEEYIIQPIDYVGEQPLAQGYFTYSIAVTDINDLYGLSIVTIQD